MAAREALRRQGPGSRWTVDIFEGWGPSFSRAIVDSRPREIPPILIAEPPPLEEGSRRGLTPDAEALLFMGHGGGAGGDGVGGLGTRPRNADWFDASPQPRRSQSVPVVGCGRPDF